MGHLALFALLGWSWNCPIPCCDIGKHSHWNYRGCIGCCNNKVFGASSQYVGRVWCVGGRVSGRVYVGVCVRMWACVYVCGCVGMGVWVCVCMWVRGWACGCVGMGVWVGVCTWVCGRRSEWVWVWVWVWVYIPFARICTPNSITSFSVPCSHGACDCVGNGLPCLHVGRWLCLVWNYQVQ